MAEGKEKKPIEDIGKDFVPASADEESNEEQSEEQKTILTYLDKLISEEPLTIKEEDFAEDVDQSVRAIEDGRGGRKLVFDKKSVSSQEEDLIRRFLKVFDSAEDGKRKETFLNSDDDGDGFDIRAEFGWYFEEEDEEFFEELAGKLRSRLEELEAGKDIDTLGNAGLGNVDEAMAFFRSKAHRRLIKESLSEQTQQLPIIGFKAKKKDETFVDLKYNPADLNDPSNEVDFIYVNSEDGKQELIITYNNDEYVDVAPVIKPKDGNFKIPEGGFTQGGEFNDQGEEEKWWSIEVEKGENTKDPLFSRIKIIRKSVDLDTELDDYLARQKEEKEKAAAAYQSPTPSATPAPSTSRYVPQTSYVTPRSA